MHGLQSSGGCRDGCEFHGGAQAAKAEGFTQTLARWELTGEVQPTEPCPASLPAVCATVIPCSPLARKDCATQHPRSLWKHWRPMTATGHCTLSLEFWGCPGKLLPETNHGADTNRKRPLKSSVIFCFPASGPPLPLLLLALYALLMCLGAAALPFPPLLLPLPQDRAVLPSGDARGGGSRAQSPVTPQQSPAAEQPGPGAGAHTQLPAGCGGCTRTLKCPGCISAHAGLSSSSDHGFCSSWAPSLAHAAWGCSPGLAQLPRRARVQGQGVWGRCGLAECCQG